MRNVLAAIGWIIAAPLLYSIYVDVSSAPSCKESIAYINAKNKVRSRLKSPGSATFGEHRVVHVTGCTFRVTGEVTAQNGFGAMIRTMYDVNVKGEWS